MNLVICLFSCYIVGSTPFGWLAGKMIKGIDIREKGSGNIGSTNAGRILGKKYFFIVFIFDFLKGLAIIWLVPWFINSEINNLIWVSAGLVAVLGHLYPFWFWFKTGGKGIATAAGVLLAIMPYHLIVALLVFLFIVGLSRIVSLGSISATVSLPVYHFTFTSDQFTADNIFLTIFIVIVCIFVIYKHRENIQRLRRGEEKKYYIFKKINNI